MLYNDQNDAISVLQPLQPPLLSIISLPHLVSRFLLLTLTSPSFPFAELHRPHSIFYLSSLISYLSLFSHLSPILHCRSSRFQVQQMFVPGIVEVQGPRLREQSLEVPFTGKIPFSLNHEYLIIKHFRFITCCVVSQCDLFCSVVICFIVLCCGVVCRVVLCQIPLNRLLLYCPI